MWLQQGRRSGTAAHPSPWHSPSRALRAPQDRRSRLCLTAVDPGTTATHNPSCGLGQQSSSPAGGGGVGCSTDQIPKLVYKPAACKGLFCPSEGHREQCKHRGKQGWAQSLGKAGKGPSSPCRHSSLPPSLPAVRLRLLQRLLRGTYPALGSAGSGSRAGAFLCVQSFYSIKISGSYSATSPLYCPGASRQSAPPACQGPLPACWEHLGRNPLPRLLRRRPRELLRAQPLTLLKLLQEPTLKELFIDTEMSVFFPVDKTFSCGPLKK